MTLDIAALTRELEHLGAATSVTFTIRIDLDDEAGTVEAALDEAADDAIREELARLRRWKAEATEVIARWDATADLLPADAILLGEWRSTSVARYISRLTGTDPAELEAADVEEGDAGGLTTDAGHPCPVPGCTFIARDLRGLNGPHMRAHRNRGDLDDDNPHAGERAERLPNLCDGCGYRFATRAELARHRLDRCPRNGGTDYNADELDP